MSTANYSVNLYPENNGFLGEVTIEDDGSDGKGATFQTVIILDRSKSMSKQVARMVNKVLPIFFEKLSYTSQNVINLITFDSKTEVFSETVKKFPTLVIKYRKGTKMAPAIDKCSEVFEELDVGKPIRLLTISDGEINDQEETEKMADAFSKNLIEMGFFINSKAVRLFTSSSEPDTRALCCLLQVNNATPKSLVDIDADLSDEGIAKIMVDLFAGDDFGKSKVLMATENILCLEPWNQQIASFSKVLLLPGKNIFWLTKLPASGLKVNGSSVKLCSKPPLTPQKYEELLASKSNFFLEKIKILQVAGSDESKEVAQRMTNHFEETQKALYSRAQAEDDGLRDSLSSRLTSIANNTNVSKMSSAEKAVYIRK